MGGDGMKRRGRAADPTKPKRQREIRCYGPLHDPSRVPTKAHYEGWRVPMYGRRMNASVMLFDLLGDQPGIDGPSDDEGDGRRDRQGRPEPHIEDRSRAHAAHL